MISPVLASALVALVLDGPALGTDERKTIEPTVPLVEALKQTGVDEVFLDTTYRFAAEFNSRPPGRRRGARIVGVEGSFFRAMTPRVYSVHGPIEPERAREYLRTRLKTFLDGYVDLLIDLNVFDIELRQSETIDEYLKRAASARRCNQIPCLKPPCCMDCSGPSGTASPCPP